MPMSSASTSSAIVVLVACASRARARRDDAGRRAAVGLVGIRGECKATGTVETGKAYTGLFVSCEMGCESESEYLGVGASAPTRTPAAKTHGPRESSILSTKISCDASNTILPTANQDARSTWSPPERRAARGRQRSRSRPMSRSESATMSTWRSSKRPLQSW